MKLKSPERPTHTPGHEQLMLMPAEGEGDVVVCKRHRRQLFIAYGEAPDGSARFRLCCPMEQPAIKEFKSREEIDEFLADFRERGSTALTRG